MVGISSIKPFAKSAVIAANQMRAKASWEAVFSAIWYFNAEPELDLASPKTRMEFSEEFPLIRDLVVFAAQQTEWTCILNADIIVAPELLQVEQELIRRKAQSAISRRWQLPENKVVDRGLDWFAGTPELWMKLLPQVPSQFRIGNILWDTWMLNAFTSIGDPRRSYDVTACRMIFHPKHDDRHYPFDIQAPEELNRSKIIWPRPLIMRQTKDLATQI